MQSHICQPEQLLPEFTSKYSISVRYNNGRKPMQLVDMIQKYFSYTSSSERVFKGYEMTIFGKGIYHHQDAVKVARLRKPFDKVQRYNLPG
jgi:hypothetical protein